MASKGFWDPLISICFATHNIFLVGCSKGGWLATPLDLPLVVSTLDLCFVPQVIIKGLLLNYMQLYRKKCMYILIS